ncbi:Bublin coiled-coil protein [Trichinella pseudospiralis]
MAFSFRTRLQVVGDQFLEIILQPTGLGSKALWNWVHRAEFLAGQQLEHAEQAKSIFSTVNPPDRHDSRISPSSYFSHIARAVQLNTKSKSIRSFYFSFCCLVGKISKQTNKQTNINNQANKTVEEAQMPCETNNIDESVKINDGYNGEQTPTTPVRLRRNGNNSTADSHEVIRRGLATLAETDLEENMTEIKKLDSQIDHLNDYMAKVERRNSELTGRLQSFLQSQKEERDKRRASFYQRQQESEAAQIEFNNQVRAMLMRCQQARGGPPIDTSGYGSGAFFS